MERVLHKHHVQHNQKLIHQLNGQTIKAVDSRVSARLITNRLMEIVMPNSATCCGVAGQLAVQKVHKMSKQWSLNISAAQEQQLLGSHDT